MDILKPDQMSFSNEGAGALVPVNGTVRPGVAMLSMGSKALSPGSTAIADSPTDTLYASSLPPDSHDESTTAESDDEQRAIVQMNLKLLTSHVHKHYLDKFSMSFSNTLATMDFGLVHQQNSEMLRMGIESVFLSLGMQRADLPYSDSQNELWNVQRAVQISNTTADETSHHYARGILNMALCIYYTLNMQAKGAQHIEVYATRAYQIASGLYNHIEDKDPFNPQLHAVVEMGSAAGHVLLMLGQPIDLFYAPILQEFLSTKHPSMRRIQGLVVVTLGGYVYPRTVPHLTRIVEAAQIPPTMYVIPQLGVDAGTVTPISDEQIKIYSAILDNGRELVKGAGFQELMNEVALYTLVHSTGHQEAIDNAWEHMSLFLRFGIVDAGRLPLLALQRLLIVGATLYVDKKQDHLKELAEYYERTNAMDELQVVQMWIDRFQMYPTADRP
eukprot:GFYU01005354.1.p1 GENE.GFYU01005354.1~~GFYU01005354.1.p1  ORF type:complete len:444 (-),score=66.88 GFYU01005354.1:178-1509(-)